MSEKKKKKSLMPTLQKLGQSLMLPLAVMPAAAILMRFGAPDVFDIPVLATAGGAIITNFGILFAIAVAVGFSDESGIAGLSGALAYIVMLQVAQSFNASIDVGVFGGIVIGFVVAYLYRRFYRIQVPNVLAFFGGKRFVPIISALAALVFGVFFGFTWPIIQGGLNNFGEWLMGLGEIGPTVFMIFNRALLPFGLHHIPNNFVFFQLGSFADAGALITGEIPRFFAGDPTAGKFLVGFFPIMLAGYPAAALAIAHTAKKENRKVIMGIMMSAALTSFLTGITEPIEFAFTFVAPMLYVANILLSALSAVVTNLLGLTAGFGFSAGLVDYVLGYGLSSGPIVLLLVSAVFGVVFYVVFRFLIVKFNLPTPGREVVDEEE